jgi:NADH:ubiquinone oxidoreductase subunit 3 (subunit A)
MIGRILLSPPAAFAVFLLLAYGLYRLGGRIAAPGEHHEDKHLAYTGGETVSPPTTSRISYHAFFRLALLFAILHVATLVLSTLPGGVGSRRAASVYAVGIAISVLVLAKEEA